MLAGWQAALQHPIEHVDEYGEFVHLDAGHSHDGDSKAGALCDLLAALTACASQAQVLFADHLSAYYAVPSRPAEAPRVAQAPPFLSQGPPSERV